MEDEVIVGVIEWECFVADLPVHEGERRLVGLVVGFELVFV